MAPQPYKQITDATKAKRRKKWLSQGSSSNSPWLLPLLLGLLLGAFLHWVFVVRTDLHGRILSGLASLESREQEGIHATWRQHRDLQDAPVQPSTGQYLDAPQLSRRSPLISALRQSTGATKRALRTWRAQQREAQKLTGPLLDRALKSLAARREFVESEHVPIISQKTKRELHRAKWPDVVCKSMKWQPGNLSELLPLFQERQMLPTSGDLVHQCVQMYQEAQELEENHRKVMQEAQQLAYEMARVDVMLKKMSWLDQNRNWWLEFRAMATKVYKVNLLEHTMDGVRVLYWRIGEKDRWKLTKWLSCYLPYAREWEIGWPDHPQVVNRAQDLMDSLGAALGKYMEMEFKFKEAEALLADRCGLGLPSKNWTAVHDKALDDMKLASVLSGSDIGHCADLDVVQEELTWQPVMQAPMRMWKKDPEVYSPEDRPHVSFLLQYRGSAANVKPIVEALYKCTRGMIGKGELGEGVKSELYVNMLDPYKTMWPWILSWVASDKGKFVVPILPQLVPDNAAINDLAFMARGTLLVVLFSDQIPPSSCQWLKNTSAAFSAWPDLGLAGFHSDEVPAPPGVTASPGGVELVAKTAPEVAYRWYAIEAALPAAALRDPASGVSMHFTGMVSRGPLVFRRDVFQFLGGMDELDSRQEAAAALADLRLCFRIWLSGHQVAKIDVAQGDVSPFFKNMATKENSNTNMEQEEMYSQYDLFLAQYNDVIEQEVGRLNALLDLSEGNM